MRTVPSKYCWLYETSTLSLQQITMKIASTIGMQLDVITRQVKRSHDNIQLCSRYTGEQSQHINYMSTTKTNYDILQRCTCFTDDIDLTDEFYTATIRIQETALLISSQAKRRNKRSRWQISPPHLLPLTKTCWLATEETVKYSGEVVEFKTLRTKQKAASLWRARSGRNGEALWSTSAAFRLSLRCFFS